MTATALRSTLGQLSCHISDHGPGDGPPQRLVLLCHGYGAGGDDLVPLAAEIERLGLARRTRFVFPTAPLPLPQVPLYDARAWWHLDVDRIMQRSTEGGLRALTEEVPEGMADARRKLQGTVELALQQSGLDYDALILGGFSQGSMISADLCFRLEERPRALVVLSGTLVAVDEWRRHAARRRGLPVFQRHGTQDPVLPVRAAHWLHELLTEAELSVDFAEFTGGHTIPMHTVEELAGFLRDH